MATAANRVLYWGSGSPPCWRVMIMLNEKRLPYTSKKLEFSKREHKSPEVLAINPRGQLPSFQDGAVVVNESLAAVQYLEEAYPEPALMPKDVAQRAHVLQRFFEVGTMYTKLQEAVFMKMRGQIKGPDDEKLFAERVANLQAELAIWDGYLAKSGGFIAGSTFTLADVAAAPCLLSLERYGATITEAGSYPHLAKYMQTVRARPSVADSWPPHWTESPNQTWLADVK